MLTPEGRAVASELVSAARFHEQRILDRLPAGSARQLKEALKEINALYEAEGAIDRDDA
jgi:DNA-binding MarR family transcriptional regulator